MIHKRYLVLIIFAYSLLCHVANAVEYKVDLIGIQNLDKEKLLENLSITGDAAAIKENEALRKRLIAKGSAELQTALQTFGYYQATIQLSQSTINDKTTITYNVDLGAPMTISIIDIAIDGDGIRDKSISAWKNSYPLKIGEILNQHKYEDAKRELLRLLHNRGYFKHEFTDRRIDVDTKFNKASIIIHLNTGTRYRYGEIIFSQENDVFELNYLENFLSFKSGQLFKTTDLISSQQHFAVSDEFRTVEVEPLLNQIDLETVPIAIRLTPKKPVKYELGAGYATDTGPRALASVERRQVTRSGHRAKANLQVSKIKSLVNASYRVPLKKSHSDYFLLSGERKSEDSDTVISQTNTLSFDYAYALPNWLRTITLSYLKEHYELTDDVVKDSKLLIPGITFEYVHTIPPDRNQINWQFNIGLKGADTAVVSDTSFAQTNLYTWLRVPISKVSRLVNYTKIGYSWTSEFAELPASQRYFTGGDYTIRGYSYNSLGPTDVKGAVVGGEKLLVTSLEYQHLIKTDLYGNLFYDIGNAFNKNDFTPKSGAGFGLGWGFPFGSLRLYAASALSNDGNPWRLHLMLGADL